MLSETGLRTIAELLIGDIQDYYKYKSGSRIVEFFNTNFGFSDTYGQGFPPRWFYTTENLKKLYSHRRFDEFLSLILSKGFVKIDGKLNDVEALEKIQEIIDYLNNELSIEGYKILKNGKEYSLISEDNDLDFVGEGGFANVYKSKSANLIVKKLKDDFLTNRGIKHRFKREYSLTKSLSDIQGVITVYDFDELNYSYTMEIAEKTLEEFMNEFDHDENGKIMMIRQILCIMSEVHERNIIHRDISPNNVLLFNGQLKLSDFGLGKDLDMFHSHRTVRTHSLGQYYYCAPEQFMQLKEGDKRSDVYSLGSLINFIMTGDPRNTRHFLCNPSEKAKQENPNMRYADAGNLSKGIEQAIKYHKNQERSELVFMKLKKNLYDDDIENYLYSLDGKELCQAIVSMPNMVSAVLKFIDNEEKRAIEVLKLLKENYPDICKVWEDYDNFGTIAFNVIRDNYAFVAQEIAARILYSVAYEVNRFNIQRLVDQLLETGVDPIIEDMLK